jgi:ribosomal protein S19
MVLVHNGKDFKKMVITREKVGFKFGEFIGTRSLMNKVKKSKVLAKKK